MGEERNGELRGAPRDQGGVLLGRCVTCDAQLYHRVLADGRTVGYDQCISCQMKAAYHPSRDTE